MNRQRVAAATARERARDAERRAVSAWLSGDAAAHRFLRARARQWRATARSRAVAGRSR